MNPQLRTSINYFVGLLQEVFKYPAGGQDVSVQLLELRQGTDSATEFQEEGPEHMQLGWISPEAEAIEMN